MICFDTGPVIWGVQGKAKQGQEEMVERTRRYIKFLSERNVRIMLPTPVVSEYLLGFDEAEQAKQIQVIRQVFRVGAYDMQAAVIAAELEANRRLMDAIRKTTGVDRNRLRVDAQVVAIGIAARAEKIVTNDEHLQDLAQGRIKIVEVPAVHTQMDLPFDIEA